MAHKLPQHSYGIRNKGIRTAFVNKGKCEKGIRSPRTKIYCVSQILHLLSSTHSLLMASLLMAYVDSTQAHTMIRCIEIMCDSIYKMRNTLWTEHVELGFQESLLCRNPLASCQRSTQ